MMGAMVKRSIGVSALLLAVTVPATGQGISTDTSVGMVELSSFEGLSAPQVWERIDSLPSWAIPLEPPADYYDLADTTSAATLHATLHGIIDGHEVYRYTHPTRPGDANHRPQTCEVLRSPREACTHRPPTILAFESTARILIGGWGA